MRYKNDYDTAGVSLNTIFLKILDNLHRFRKEDSFISWIKRIAVNQLIDEYRKQKREMEKLNYMEELSVSKSPSVIHEKEAEIDSEYLLEMIRTLPPVTSRVFNLYAIDGFKHREIAEMLEMSENTSKWHIREARKILQAKLEVFNEKVTS
jgi:RNA polymerase sigma-70 factor (ECF subfamily)